MPGIVLYGLKLNDGRTRSAKGATPGSLSAASFTTLTAELLAQIPAFREFPGIRGQIEVLPMQAALREIGGQVPTDLLAAGLQGLELDTRGGMTFLTPALREEFAIRYEGESNWPKTLRGWIPFLQESADTFRGSFVKDPWNYSVSGNSSMRIYLSAMLHYHGPKPLALVLDIFIARSEIPHRIRTTFSIGELIDSTTEQEYESFSH